MMNEIIPVHDDYIHALNQIFGRTIIAMDLNVASRISEEHNIDCITLDGDYAKSRGIFSGGSRGDSSTSKLKISNTLVSLGQSRLNIEDQLHTIDQKLKECESNVSLTLQLMQTNENNKKKCRTEYGLIMTS
jgi:structural maintenance of chromosome 3 (chondroitin sulfate proteoglycan 6)